MGDGIDNNEVNGHDSSHDSIPPLLEDDSDSMPLLAGAAGDNENIHKYISDSIHQDQCHTDMGKDSSPSTVSSTQTTTSPSCSEKNSPDEQVSHIVDKIAEFSGGTNEQYAGVPSGVINSAELLEGAGDRKNRTGNAAAGTQQGSDLPASSSNHGNQQLPPQQENWDTDEDEAAQEEQRRIQDEEYTEYFRCSVHINAETNERSMSLIIRVATVMEKSWNFEIFWNFWNGHGILTKIGKGHGKVMAFGNWSKRSWNLINKFLILMNWHRYAATFQNPTNVYVD